jgi:hypothetical protein
MHNVPAPSMFIIASIILKVGAMSMAPPSMPIPDEYLHTVWGLRKIYNITTKNMTKNLNLLILAVALLITACDKQDAEGNLSQGLPFPTNYQVSSEIWSTKIPEKDAISLTTFKEKILGYGWKETETYELNDDGTYDNNREYWREVLGGGPSRYFFKDDKVVMFSYVDAIAALGYYNLSFQYNEEDNRLYINNNPLFTILTIGEKEITAVKMAGLQDDYQSLGKMKYVYHFVKLSRMTEMELQETRQRYYKDLSNWK